MQDLEIPAFLKRAVTAETKAEVDRILGLGGAPRVWAPIRSAEECKAARPKKIEPVYAVDPDFPVHVVMGNPVQTIQKYDNFDHFQKSHDLEDYPVVRTKTAAGVMYIQVADKSNDGIVAVRAPGAPRKAGIRDIIWKRADELWAIAGFPKDVPTVLKLRKEWMILLEKEGINRMTCSSEFGNWQKDRLAK